MSERLRMIPALLAVGAEAWTDGYRTAVEDFARVQGDAVTAPIQAIADALEAADDGREHIAQSIYDADAEVAVDAYRRHVFASRPDAERRLIDAVESAASRGGTTVVEVYIRDVLDLLAALADETEARQAAEAASTRWQHRAELAESQVHAARSKLADLADGELAHRSRDYGRGVAQAVRDVQAVLDGTAVNETKERA